MISISKKYEELVKPSIRDIEKVELLGWIFAEAVERHLMNKQLAPEQKEIWASIYVKVAEKETNNWLESVRNEHGRMEINEEVDKFFLEVLVTVDAEFNIVYKKIKLKEI